MTADARLFEPVLPPVFAAGAAEVFPGVGDRGDGEAYVYDPEGRIVMAVNVALATNRPLLVGGPAGSGKSSLAAAVAKTLKWRYLEEVVSSRTQARDLLWRFDTIRRLRDAQANDLRGDREYIEPGVFWKALDPVGAASFSADQCNPDDRRRAVVLLDEIDKADPDVPDDLLVPLGSMRFDVQELGLAVSAAPETAPFVLITTNDERQLSKPFVRRCVVLRLEHPFTARLVDIANARLGERTDGLYTEVATLVQALAAEAERSNNPVPSTAEYLDTLQACVTLRIGPGSDEWALLSEVTLTKQVKGSDARSAQP